MTAEAKGAMLSILSGEFLIEIDVQDWLPCGQLYMMRSLALLILHEVKRWTPPRWFKADATVQ